MNEKNGIYAFEKSTRPVVDYPALVNSMNKYFWADTGGNWILKGDQVSWSEGPWQYMPDGYPCKVVESYRYAEDSDGKLVMIKSKKNGKCEGEIESDIFYFETDKCEDVPEEELIEELATHIKSGWIEIASAIVGEGDQFFTLNLRIHASRKIRITESEVDQFTIQRRFGVCCGSEGQSEAGGEL
jgi:hypothetical protein